MSITGPRRVTGDRISSPHTVAKGVEEKLEALMMWTPSLAQLPVTAERAVGNDQHYNQKQGKGLVL